MPGTQFQHNCPHCLTRGAGFKVAYQWQSNKGVDYANILAICGVCNLGMTIESYAPAHSSHPDLLQYSVAYPAGQYFINKFWPNNKADLPDGVPNNVATFYSQGLENLFEHRWDAAGAMFRKTLDTGTKFLSPEHKGLSLFKRINALVDQGLLTEAIGDWSHEIRLDGNDAVHDEMPETEDDARASQRFTEAFLNYAFSLPQLVAKNRTNRELTE